MAKITKGQDRLIEADYHIYAQLVGGDTTVLVRRQLALPQDVIHPSSLKTALQRSRIAKASYDWSHLSYAEKMWWRNQIQWSAHGDVLTSERLYISLSVDAQRKAQEAEKEPFVPPTTILAPCLVTQMPNGQEMWVQYVSLRKAGTTQAWKTATNISIAHFKFEHVAETFQPSQLWGTHGIAEPYSGEIITTRSELAHIRRLNFGFVSGVWLETYQALPPYTQYQLLAPSLGNLLFTGNTFRSSGNFPHLGMWSVSYTVTLKDYHYDHYFLKHDHRPNTTFKWNNSYYPLWWNFICNRNFLGIHDIVKCDPFVIPI